MPIYEYRCADCKRRVSLLYQTFSAASAATPTCTNCGSLKLTRLVSRVYQLKSEDAQLDDLADPSSFGDLDENDPKSVARWARKLGQQMGEDLGDDWGDMVDKLEAGEDLSDEGGPGGEVDGGGADGRALGARFLRDFPVRQSQTLVSGGKAARGGGNRGFRDRPL